MWKVIQELLPATLIIIFVSQYALPVLFDKPTWWLFKRNKKTTKDSSQLEVELNETKNSVNELKNKASSLKEDLEKNLKNAEDLKKEGDNLI